MADKKVALHRMRHAQVNEFLTPELKTDFQMITENRNESIYDSSKNKVLGKGRQPVTAPACALKKCFGLPTDRSQDIRKLIYPFGDSIKHCSHYSEFHDLNALQPKNTDCYGCSTRGDPSGGAVRDLMRWSDPQFLQSEDYFIAQQQKQYGILLEKYFKDLSDASNEFYYLYYEGKSSQPTFDQLKPTKMSFKSKTAILCSIMHFLKDKHQHHFKNTLTAFKEYDQAKAGKISAQDIDRMCRKFGIVVPIQILEDIVTRCDKFDKDGFLSFEEFEHYLNWRKNNVLERGDAEIACPEYIKNYYKTSASDYVKYDPPFSEIPVAGVPRVRVDLPVPNCPKLHDYTDYGEAADISSILRPTVFQDHGVYEADLVNPRPKYEIEKILLQDGILPNPNDFNLIWQKVSRNDKASIEDFLEAMSQVATSRHFMNCSKFSL